VIRPTLRMFHLVLALGGGLLVAVTGLSGAILTFQTEIDAALNSSLWHIEPSSVARGLDEILATVKTTDGPAPRMFLFPNRRDRAIVVLLAGRGSDDRWEVFVDPSTARLLGRRRLGSGWLERVKRLHVEVFAGRRGRVIVGLGGLCSLVLGATGFMLWWRTRRRMPRYNRRTLMLDVHRQAGIFGLLPMTIVALAGAMLIFRPYLTPVFHVLTGPLPSDTGIHSTVDHTLASPSLDKIYNHARQIHPDATITRLYLPEGSRGTFAVRMRLPEEQNPHGNTAVYFDRYTGQLIHEQTARNASPLQKLLWYAPYPWHMGDALGMTGQCIAALSGLLPSALLATGLVWWRFRRG
jgi:uncharacterized iron-regulated membrane protein